MKILQICNKMPYPPRDGGSIAILNLTRSFSRLGHEVTMLSMVTSKYDAFGTGLPAPEHKIRLYTVGMDTRIKYTVLFINILFSKEPYISKRFVSANFTTKLIGVLKAHKFDIIHLEGTYLLPYLETIRKFSNAVVALRSHNLEYEIWEGIAKNIRNPLKKIYLNNLAKRLKAYEKQYMNRYDLLIPITHRDEIKFRIMGNLKPSMICHSGCDIENLHQPDTSVYNTKLFFLGSLDWIPNVQGLEWFALKVLPLLSKKYPDITFCVAGRNPSNRIINKLKNAHIIFYGEVTDAEEFIKSKGIMVVPLFSGSGMRVKIIDAMAAGKPVVATTKAAEGIDIVPGENILLADTADDFACQIESLLNSVELYEKIRKNAFDLIRNKYDNMQIASSLIAFYKKHLS